MLLIRNIGAIVGVRHEAGKALRGSEMDALPVLHDAWLAVEGERIHSYGQMSECPAMECETIDACGRSSRRSATRTPIWSLPAAGSGSLSTKSMA